MDIELKLQALKMNVLRNYRKSAGKWKHLFECCLFKASGENNLGWFILTCLKAVVPSTQAFYEDIINGFRQTKVTVRYNFNCSNETSNLPLWNNTIITDNQLKALGCSILRPQGILRLEQVIEEGQIVSFVRLATKCKILPFNTGRTVAGLKRNVKAE